MKSIIKSLLLLLFFTISNPIVSQIQKNDLIGNWQGILKVQDVELRMIFKISESGDGLKAVLDSPDQSAFNIPIDTVILNNNMVKLPINRVAGFYEGKLIKDSSIIHGNWNQGGQDFQMQLVKTQEEFKLNRPQEPQKPYPYIEEEVTFENTDAGITLAGTFTYPQEGTSFPAVVLVTGSGPQNRDEEVFAHKPFLIWADHLTRSGIAVLRYDDRGIGKSKGDFNSSTTADLATDAIAAVNYLKNRNEINNEKIGVVGHSEGGIIAPLAANHSEVVSFIVLCAGTAVPGYEVILLQSELISKRMGESEEKIKKDIDFSKKIFDVIINSKDKSEANEEIDRIYKEYYESLPEEEKSKPENSKEALEQIKKSFSGPWFKYFLEFDPATELEKLDVPVLALFGENDLQVIPSQNKEEMENALAKSKSENYKIVVLPGLNHLFQESETGLPSDYSKIEQTTSPLMLETMTKWIMETVGY